jgi:hypothetical protein
MIAINESATEALDVAPAAGPATGPATGSQLTGAPGAAPPAVAPLPVFPSSTLPATNQAGGSGADLVAVPDLFGLTEIEAEAALNAVDLNLGGVTIVSHLAPTGGFGLISTAYAGEESQPTVVSQSPAAGTLIERFGSVQIVVQIPVTNLPEASSLVMFWLGVGLILFLFWRTNRRTSEAV